MRLHLSTRTLGITASMLSVAILVPASVLAAGPRDGTCDPAGNGPNGPVASAPGPAAGNGPRAQANGNGNGFGHGAGIAANGNSYQARRNPGQGLRQPAMGVLTADQKLDLAAMAEEEKLAHDVYTQLGALLGGTELERIAASEANHLAAIRNLLAKYGIKDPTAGMDLGRFTTQAFQDLYDQFYAQGSVSLAAAYDVGVAIEKDDLVRLADAKVGVTAQNVLRVYTNLTAASERHLAAFSAL
jgi:hypothetical protein